MASEGSYEFIGTWVLLNCGDLGSYTGQIVSVSAEKITITKATQDGKPCPSIYVTFNGEFLQDMKLLDGPPDDKSQVEIPDPVSSVTKKNKKTPMKESQQQNQFTLSLLGSSNSGNIAPTNSLMHNLTEGAESQVPVNKGDERREKLRKIPNTVTAYICPVSPPPLRRICRKGEEGSANSPRSSKQSHPYPNEHNNNQTSIINNTGAPSNLGFQPYRRRSTSEMGPGEVTSSGGSRNAPTTPQSAQHHRGGGGKASANKRGTPTNTGGRHGNPKGTSWVYSDVDEVLGEEFDFEKNLALFDKEAFYQKAKTKTGSGPGRHTPKSGSTERHDSGDTRDRQNAVFLSSKPDLVRGVDSLSGAYKCTEFVLSDAAKCPPVDSRELIRLPRLLRSSDQEDLPDWLTDQGRRIPVLGDLDLRGRLFDLAEKSGLTWGRIVENTGRAIAEIIIKQLGGSERLSVSNLHQSPQVVVLLGRHKTGSIGVAVARHLIAREVKIFLCLPEWAIVEPFSREFATELQLLKALTNQDQVLRNPSNLPTTPVDMIVSCIEEFESPNSPVDSETQSMFQWCRANRAPLLVINPPVVSAVSWKLCLHLGIPAIAFNKILCHNEDGNYWPPVGRSYLVDIGFTRGLYERVGINYLSPFGGSSVISINSSRANQAQST